jgi:hypothetical protein
VAETVRASRGNACTRFSDAQRSSRNIKIRSSHKFSEIGLTALLLSLDMLSMIRLHSVQELLTTCGVPDVLHTQAHTFLDVSVPNDFVYDDTNGTWCDVAHDACSAVSYEFDKYLYLVI